MAWEDGADGPHHVSVSSADHVISSGSGHR